MKRLSLLLGAAALGAAIFVAGALLPTRAAQSPRPLTTASPTAPPSSRDQLMATISSLQARVKGNPRDPEALASLGLAYLQEARLTVDPSYYTKADESLTRSVRIERRGNFEGFLGMGMLAAARHRFDLALEWARRAQKADPYNAEVRGLESDALIELGRYRAAQKELQKMVDLRPGVSSLARVSYYRELHGDLRGAIAAMAAAFRDAGGSGQDSAWTSFQLGDLQLLQGHVGRADFLYRRGHYLDPSYYLPRVGIAKVAAARGRYRSAARILERVTRTYPAPIYVMLLGDVLRAEGFEGRARRQYGLVRAEQRLFSANGVIPDTEMMVFFADHHQRLKSTLREARREYAKRPSVRVADALSWVLYACGKYHQASTFSRRALRLGSADPSYLFHAGMIAKSLGQRRVALDLLRRAVRNNPRFSVRYGPQAARAISALKSGS